MSQICPCVGPIIFLYPYVGFENEQYGQFERDLSAAGQPVGDFQHVHQGLMRLACARPGHLLEAPSDLLSRHTGLLSAFAMVEMQSGRSNE